MKRGHGKGSLCSQKCRGNLLSEFCGHPEFGISESHLQDSRKQNLKPKDSRQRTHHAEAPITARLKTKEKLRHQHIYTLKRYAFKRIFCIIKTRSPNTSLHSTHTRRRDLYLSSIGNDHLQKVRSMLRTFNVCLNAIKEVRGSPRSSQ